MFKKSRCIVFICGLMLLLITIISSDLIFENAFEEDIVLYSLLFTILVEIIGIIKAIVLEKTIISFVNIFISFVHFLTTIICSGIFIYKYPDEIHKYILLNVIAICIYSVIDIIIVYFSNRVMSKQGNLYNNQSILRACVEEITRLEIEFDDSVYKKDFEKISEMLRFTDNSSLSGDEAEILNDLKKLRTLLKTDSEYTAETIEKVKNLIRFRSEKIRNIKYGKH